MSLESEFLGRWPLAGDCRDASPAGNHGRNHGVRFADETSPHGRGPVACFNGRDALIEVPDARSLAFGTGDFAISVWIKTDEDLADVVGDVAGKFDPIRRKGFNFNVKSHAGMTSCQSNRRNVHFGIDDATIDAEWTDCGRPGDSVLVAALAAHDGGLYAGTLETRAGQCGHVYRYEGGESWTDCGSPDAANTVFSLAVHRGVLHAATSGTKGSGSALGDLPNQDVPGGTVYRYEGPGRWVSCDRPGDGPGTGALTSFGGELHAASAGAPGVYKLGADGRWRFCGAPGGRRSGALGVYCGRLYSAGKGSAGVWRYDGGEDWTDCGRPGGEVTVYGFAVYEGGLHVGTWENAKVMRYEGGGSWTFLGRPGYNMEVMAMAVYNGKLYAGVLPMGEVYRFEPPNLWTRTGWLDRSDAKLRRVWTMAVHGGKLYAGTLPSGRVFRIEAGRSATCDRELKGGWRHLAAVKDAGQLKLYVDAKLAASSSRFNPADYDLTNDRPLRIGFGQHDTFNGCMSDLRIYGRALSEPDVGDLARRVL